MPWLLLLGAYLLGSIPFGWLVARFFRVDIRSQGSGNIGATNVFRTLGPFPGAIVFALDFFKGWLAVLFGYWTGQRDLAILLLGMAAVFGHMFSVFLGFKGGKGVATGLGVLAGFAPDVFILSVFLAAIIIYASHYVSVASLVTSAAASLLMFVFGKPLPFSLTVLAVTILIFFRHRGNIERLRTGKEAKVW